MTVSPLHTLHQGPVLAALVRTALAALNPGRSSAILTSPPTTPGPEHHETVAPRPARLVHDYLRHVGGDPAWYRGQLPFHLYPQWGFPILSRTLAGLPSRDLIRVLNGGCGVTINGGLPAREPLQLRARLERYLELRGAALSRLDDAGRSILITTRFAQTYQAHLLRAPLGARQQVTFGREPVSNLSFAPGEREVLLYMADSGGNEQYQIVRLDLRGGGRTTLLTDGKSRQGGYLWSHDGQRIAYTSNARNGRDMDIYLGDGRSAASGALLLERAGHWELLDWSRDGKLLLIAEYISINESRLYVVHVASKQVTRLHPPAPAASHRAARFDASGRRVYATTDREGEFVELYEVALPGAPAGAAVKAAGAPAEAAGSRPPAWRPLTRAIRWPSWDQR